MMAETPPAKLVMLRLSEKADKLIRKKVERRGDIHRLVNDAIQAVDYTKLHVESRNRPPGSGRQVFITTSVKLDPVEYEDIAESAKNKNVSASALLDAIIIKHYGRPSKAG